MLYITLNPNLRGELVFSGFLAARAVRMGVAGAEVDILSEIQGYTRLSVFRRDIPDICQLKDILIGNLESVDKKIKKNMVQKSGTISKF